MAITITQRQDKWRMKIESEEWEFENRESFEKILKELFDIKQQHGRLNY